MSVSVIDLNYLIAIVFLAHLSQYYIIEAELYEGSPCKLYDGTLGTCKSLKKCRWAIDHLRSGRITYDDIREATCFYAENDQIICCGDERPSSTEQTITQAPIGGNDEDDITFFDNSDDKSEQTINSIDISQASNVVKSLSSFEQLRQISSTTLIPKLQILLISSKETNISNSSNTNNGVGYNNTNNSNKNNSETKMILYMTNGNEIDNITLIQGERNDNDLFPPVTTRIIPTKTTTSTAAPIRTRRSDDACKKYTNLSSPFISFHILNGVETSIGEFPHMAALGYPSQEIDSYEYEFNCGGSIISEQYILTAAHCVRTVNTPTVVRMGKVTLHTNDDGAQGLTGNIAKIIAHPNYRTNQQYNDIALIKLVEPIVFNDEIRPACLRSNKSDIDQGIELIVTGWGATSTQRNKRSDILLKTNLTSISITSCNQSYEGYNNRRLRQGIVLSQLCAFDPIARNDACVGDSGGPLQIVETNGKITIVGITSFSVACGTVIPGVYTRVAYYLDWIESIVWPDS